MLMIIIISNCLCMTILAYPIILEIYESTIIEFVVIIFLNTNLGLDNRNEDIDNRTLIKSYINLKKTD